MKIVNSARLISGKSWQSGLQ